MTLADSVCECCNRKREIVGVASCSIGPVSIAWCLECLRQGAEPLNFVNALAEMDGEEGYKSLAEMIVFHEGEYKEFRKVPRPSA